MSRVYAAEPVPTLLGGAADHRFVAGPAAMHAVATGLAAGILGEGATPADAPPWLAAVVADLHAAGARALVHGGPSLPAETHALIHRVNERLGARGTTFDLIAPVAYRGEDEAASMASLIGDMGEGRVSCLLILGGNPVYAAKGFREALPRVPFSLSLSAAPDETARAATWYVPGAHVFETWGDLVAHDGTVAIQQPQSLPLYNGRSALEALALLTQDAPVDALAAVRATWRDRLDDAAWSEALANGVVPGTARKPEDVRLRPEGAPGGVAVPPARALNLLIRPDPNLLDGRGANNPWLQELPRPIGKVVWTNPVLLAPATAQALQVENGDEIALSMAGAAVLAPAWIVPGQAADCVLAWLGGGRTSAGEVGNGVGVDVTKLRGIDAAPSLRKTGRRHAVASTDHHNMLDVDRGTVDTIVRHATLAAFEADRHVLAGEGSEPSIYHRPQDGGVAWGMSVDLNACIGCNACVVACQAENNVPVVGPDQVRLGREMHWLRIDRYYEGDAEAPETFLQPMLCMHCEDAPCEPVCPVEASIHDSEGLNLQVYNRCIGTRFCSNNCPYKVRRFNFGAWAADEHRPDISRNPDVTVRSRGVMEKCTFCVQRIWAARIAHDRDGVPEQVVTACQAACPTSVFTFGNIHDADSEVAKRKASPLDYALLADQNTHPRLTYEGRIRNRHKDLPA
ncbi:MAG: 4Fe-4S dicluster domain-containing protein [Acetobacteraceae bacterium]|nr:4Fe-4S dicluster domain-containing protein [Acetobacteraceae bacterium]